MKTADRKSYDPGKPNTIIPQGKGRYVVYSFTNDRALYMVNLNERPTCTCPHHQHRGARCKHIQFAETESYLEALRIARSLTLEQLERQAKRTDLRPEVRAAVETALDAMRERVAA